MHRQDDYSTIDTKRRLAGPKTLDFSLEETNCTLTHNRHSPKNSTLSHDDEVIIGSRFNFQHALITDERSSCGTERQRRLQKSLRNQGQSQFNESFQSFPSQDEKFMPQDISISEICHQMYDKSFISDRISLQRPFSDLETVRISERKSVRDPSEHKAILFFKTKLYYKYLLLLKNNANNRRQATVQLLYFIEMNTRDKLIDAISVWRNNAILSGTIPSDRSEDLIKKKRSRQTKSPKVPNLDLETSYTSVCLNPHQIYRYICGKKVFRAFQQILRSRENKEKSRQFFYYNMLFKHMYRWIEFAKNKPSLVDNMTTRRSEIEGRSIVSGRCSNPITTNRTHRERDIPTNRDPLRVSYITDSELSYTLSRSYIAEYVEESAMKYRQLVLKRKAYYLLKSYQILQSKKKNLNMMLTRVLKKNYMAIPFRFWHAKLKNIEKKNMATRRLVKSLVKILHGAIFSNIKDVRRILATKRRHIQAGIILKQQFAQDLKTAKPNPNLSQISMIIDKENMNTSNIDISAEIGYKKLKSQLSQIFPSKENRRPNATDNSFSSIGMNSSMNNKKTFVSSMITDKENLNKILDSPTGISSGNQECLSPRNSYKEPRRSTVNKSVSFLKNEDPRKSVAIQDKLNMSSISPIHASTKCHAQTSPIREQDLKKIQPKLNEIKRPVNPPKVTRNTKNKIPLAPNLNKSTIEHEKNDSRDVSLLGGLQNETLNISRNSGKSTLDTSYSNPKYVPVGRKRCKSTQSNAQAQIKSVPVPVPAGKSEAKRPSIHDAQKDKYKVMIKDLEDHLNFLNKKLLDQKLMNKMLVSVKQELIDESQMI